MAFDPITAGLDVAKSLIEGVVSRIPDPNAQAAARAQLEMAQQSAVSSALLGQLEVNKLEAASSSSFVAGWRPAAGWVSVAGLAYEFLIRPILPWVVQVFGHQVPPLPTLSDVLFELIFGMLGLGTMRSVDKWRGVSSETASRVIAAATTPQGANGITISRTR